MPGTEHLGLDAYEQEILDAYERGTLKPAAIQADHQGIARETLSKTHKIDVYLMDNDLEALQRKALREGIPCDVLIGSILHKYASGFLCEPAS
jgi:predicted DNA binding CopG/RHH family protein